MLCAVIAVPMSFFMALVAAPRWRPLLVALVLVPLWASYLVKVYAWRTMLNPESGFVESVFGASPGYGLPATVLVLTYLWLPYMILPVYTAMSVMRRSLIDAAADLGAGPWRTFRDVILPIIWPSLVAGSIFTFSLQPRRLHHRAAGRGHHHDARQRGLPELLGQPAVRRRPGDAAGARSWSATCLAVRRTGALDNL